jgi:hypothetical protein
LCNCMTGWTGSDCSLPSCSNQNFCSGNGQCIGYNLCKCNENWSDESCSTADCSRLNNCSKTGICVTPNVCECSEGYSGEDCSQLSSACALDLNNCSNNGVCINTACRCYSGYSGPKCELIACNTVQNCSSNGVCREPNICECNEGFEGDFCQIPTCESLNRCSYNNGICNINQTCTCKPGYSGSNCSQIECSKVNNCSNNGACIAPNVCVCNKGYEGSQCQNVIGNNQYAPVFTKNSYTVSCEESLELNSFLLQVNATDRDTGVNGLVKYFIQSKNDFQYFTIDSNTGSITLSSFLKNSLTDQLSFSVLAYDQGMPRKSAVKDVIVTVNRAILPDTCSDTVNMSKNSFEISISKIIGQNFSILLKPTNLNTTSRSVSYSLDSTNDAIVLKYVSINQTGGNLYLSDSVQIGLYQIYTTASAVSGKSTCTQQFTLSVLVTPADVTSTTTSTGANTIVTSSTVASTSTTTTVKTVTSTTTKSETRTTSTSTKIDTTILRTSTATMTETTTKLSTTTQTTRPPQTTTPSTAISLITKFLANILQKLNKLLLNIFKF